MNSGSLEDCLRHPPASQWCLSALRRSIDILVALTALIVCAVPMMALGLLVGISSKGAVLFRQKRVGLGGRLFTLYKFRSMAAESRPPGLTKAGDLRVTTLGRIMRKFKLDELPQLYNILVGEMSLIGPRPKLPQYATPAKMPYRPGVTGPATLLFRNEEEILRGLDENEIDGFYAARIQPVKARVDACYMCNASPASDLRILMRTFFSCVHPPLVPTPDRAPSESPGQDECRILSPAISIFHSLPKPSSD